MSFFVTNNVINNFPEAKREAHPFHLVKPSPWPFLTAWSLFFNLLNFVGYLHNWNPIHWENGLLVFVSLNFWGKVLPFVYLAVSMIGWFRDIISEAIYEGQHTRKVQDGLRLGFALFIVSEAMIFFSFFWSFFHFSLVPSVHIGGIWPPFGIEAPSAYGIALFNTVILISSGISLTWSHRAILAGLRKESLHGLLLTIFWAFLFLSMQYLEYVYFTSFNINDSVYGSIFFLLTGCHGFHVIVGTVFLLVTYVRQYLYHFTVENHLGFEAAAWYWHFVDVVWILLYIVVYVWGA